MNQSQKSENKNAQDRAQSNDKQGNGQSAKNGAEVTSEKADKERPSAEKGLDYFAISDMQFDVVMVVAEKSKALQAYDKYLRDSQANAELQAVFEQIKADDRKHVEQLKQFLGTV